MQGPRAVKVLFARLIAFLSPVCLALTMLAFPALAHSRHHQWVRHWGGRPASHRAVARRAVGWRSPTDPNKDAELVLDGETGKILYSRNAYAQRHPASLTKMMTLYLLFDALKRGQVKMDTPIYVSTHAASQSPTKLYAPAGSSVPVDTAIRSMVVLSANDMAVATSEALGGTESHFAELMTQKAHELGMRDTFYHNASGLPDNRQITTASDLGILARHLAYDFPQYFHYFSLTSFSYAGRVHLGHDNLLGRYAGADGMKTGYTNGSGFNLVSSVVRSGMHIIGVVMGGYTAHLRDMEMMRMLDQTFAQIANNPMLVARNDVPWKSVAVAENAQPVIAGFQFSTAELNGQSAQRLQMASLPPKGQELDEDTAESQTDEIGNIIVSTPQAQIGQAPPTKSQAPPPPTVATAPAAPPKPQQPAPAPAAAPKSQPPVAVASTPPKPVPNVKPLPRPEQNMTIAATMPKTIPDVRPLPRDDAAKVVLAAYHPQSVPDVMPLPREMSASNSLPRGAVRPTPSPGTTTAKIAKSAETQLGMQQGWAIQIGAFADVPSARAQLAAYAERSIDILGQAQRIIVPFQGVGGKTLYRARFGPFPEQKARAVCETLTTRGQTCFAATMTAH
jgi:D-alanyl-D-alanine carboxypeptidase